MEGAATTNAKLGLEQEQIHFSCCLPTPRTVMASHVPIMSGLGSSHLGLGPAAPQAAMALGPTCCSTKQSSGHACLRLLPHHQCWGPHNSSEHCLFHQQEATTTTEGSPAHHWKYNYSLSTICLSEYATCLNHNNTTLFSMESMAPHP